MYITVIKRFADISPIGYLAQRISPPMDISPSGYLAQWISCPAEISPNGYLAQVNIKKSYPTFFSKKKIFSKFFFQK